MKFSVLEFGMMKLDRNMVTNENGCATKLADVVLANEWVEVPIWGLLIQCEGHNIIYDLGCMDDAMTTGWRKGAQERTPYYPKKGGTIEEQLALFNLTPRDIDTVIASHLHVDHFGMIDRFCHCDVYVPKEEWLHAMMIVFGSADESTHGSYYKKSMSLPIKKYHFVGLNEDFEVFPGLKILTLPGHAPNLLGIMITTDSGKSYIFPSDALASPINFGPPLKLPGLLMDKEAYIASCEKIRCIVEETGAELVYSHHYGTFNKLKKAPEFYT